MTVGPKIRNSRRDTQIQVTIPIVNFMIKSTTPTISSYIVGSRVGTLILGIVNMGTNRRVHISDKASVRTSRILNSDVLESKSHPMTHNNGRMYTRTISYMIV